MEQTQRLTAEDIRSRRAANGQMREREFARIHRISEAELVAAYCGETVTRISADVPALLDGVKSLGTVMALTRNESAVHEKIGPYEKVVMGDTAGMVLGSEIDLRVFPQHWVHGFAVEKRADDGAVRRSLQFFDAAGDAVHKIHMRPESDLDAYDVLVAQLAVTDQSAEIEVTDRVPMVPPDPHEPTASAGELRASWEKLTDTHQFFPMIKRLNLGRQQALEMIGTDFAWRLDPGGIDRLFAEAAVNELPIMVFIGNRGCIQIHSGPVTNIRTMGPWLNVMDESFHMHLRADHIAALWAVRKPTANGHVTSVEGYDSAGELIVQFFGKRVEGHDERPAWRTMVEGLTPLEHAGAE